MTRPKYLFIEIKNTIRACLMRAIKHASKNSELFNIA